MTTELNDGSHEPRPNMLGALDIRLSIIGDWLFKLLRTFALNIFKSLRVINCSASSDLIIQAYKGLVRKIIEYSCIANICFS